MKFTSPWFGREQTGVLFPARWSGLGQAAGGLRTGRRYAGIRLQPVPTERLVIDRDQPGLEDEEVLAVLVFC